MHLLVYWQGFSIVILQGLIIYLHEMLVHFLHGFRYGYFQSFHGLEKNWLALYRGMWQQIKHIGGN